MTKTTHIMWFIMACRDCSC